MALAAGTRLGPYEILALSGAGGMGEVYRARDTRLNRTVAVKILPEHLSSDPQLKQRLEHEAKAISSLNHPHICTLHDVGHENGMDYLVMEYLEGESLAERLSKGSLPIEQVLRYALEIADALEKAHQRNIIHRDLKPGNIMLTKSGAKLLDFGLAKPAPVGVGGAAATTVTQSKPFTGEGMVVGTFQYMSPEQIEGKEADARSDIFAFGAVLYEMVTGRRAFEGKSSAGVAAAILASEPKPVSTLQPLTPPALERVIKTCLAKDRDERWQTVHDVKLELQWIAEAVSHPSVSSTRAVFRHERWVWVSAVVLLLGVLGAVYLRKPAERAQPTWSTILPPENMTFDYYGGPVTVSHDGRKLAFMATTHEGKDLLWVRSLGAPEAKAVPGTEGASNPFWSADDRSLGFFAGGKLKIVEASGGPVVTLCDAPGSRGGTWNRDGVILFTVTWSPIHRVSASGGTPKAITKLDDSRNERSHRWPYFLPDGEHFLYLAANFAGGSRESDSVYVASLDSKVNKLLFHARSNVVFVPGYLLYVRDRTLMAQPFDEKGLELRGQPFPIAQQVQYDELTWRGVFSASINGVLAYQGGNTGANSRLVKFDRTGKEMGSIGTPADFMSLKLSPDGQKVAVTMLDSSVANYKLWLYDLVRKRDTRLTFGPGRETFPVWAPDGSRILYSATNNTGYDLYEKRSDTTGNEELVLESEVSKYPTSWSSDGRFIAYNAASPGKAMTELWLLPRFGDRKPFQFLQANFNIGQAYFSPDGHWLVYVSDESGKAEVYVTPFPGGGSKWQVSLAGGSSPRWRRDGKELFYLAGDSELMAAEVTASSSLFQVGAVRPLFHVVQKTQASRLDVSPNAEQIGFDASPDGQWFIVNSPLLGNPPPITLITNWSPQPHQ